MTQPPGGKESAGPVNGQDSRRLLVVEDDPGLNALVTRRLQQAGYLVESVLTGAAALDAVRRDPSVLVLLDYLLPDMTAHDIVKKLKAEGEELRFAVMTGHGDEKVAVELMKLGARDYLVKDTDLGDLLPEVVRHVLGELETEERLAGAETMLKQSEERHRLLLEHAGPGIGYYDPTGKLLLLNQTGAENLNGTPADFIGKSVSELFGAEHGASILARIGIALASEPGVSYEDHLSLPSGEKWFLSNYRRIPGLSGVEQGVQIVSQDITEHKRAEQALRLSEQNLRTLAQNLPAIVYRVHLRDRSRMEFFNNMLGVMTGYREDELARGEVCSIDPLILPEDRASVVETVKRATDESRPFQVDYRITHRDGSIRHFSEQGRPVPGADGRPERIDGVIFDTTEARRSEETVRLSQDRLAEAQRTSHIGSWLWDIRGRQSFWSAELYRILGLAPDSVPPTQTSFLARVHPDDRAHLEARVAEAMQNRTSYEFDLRVVRPDGVERFVHGETNVDYDAAGEPVLVSGTCQDVTERRQAEERIAWLATFPEMNPHPVLEVDVTGQVTYRNSAATECLKRLKLQPDPKQFLPVDLPEMLKRVRAGETLALSREVTLGGEIYLESINSVQAQSTLRIYAREITAIRQAEDALRREKEQAQEYLDVAGNMFVVLDAKGKIIRVNQSACDVLGWAEQDLVGKNWFDTCLPERVRSQIGETHRRLQSDANEDVEYVENIVLTRAGTERVIAWHNTILKDAQGNFEATLSSGEDITESKRTADALVRQYKLTEALIDSPEDILIFALDREYRYTTFNEPHRREVQKVYGADIKVGMNMLEITNIPEVRQKAKQSFDRVLAGESFTEVQVQPGLDICYEFNWNPIRTDTGKVIGIAVFIRDITQRKQAEEKLRRYAEDLTLLNMLDGAINRGEDLVAVAELLNRETRKTFGGRGVSLCLLSADERQLELEQTWLSPDESAKIEKLIGGALPKVRIALKPGGVHAEVLATRRARIVSDAREIERTTAEITENILLKKLVPVITRLLTANSVMLAPLVSSGKTVGLITVGRSEPFRETELKRFSTIAEQMAVVIGRKLADDALKASEEKYRLVVEHADEAILVVQDGFLRFVNPKALEMFGYDREELLDKPFPQFVHPDDRAMVIERHQKRLHSEPIPERYVFRVVRKDSAIRWVEIGSTLTTWQGQPATVSFLSDVTERELTVERERRHQQNQAFLAETAVEFVRLGEQEDIYQHICSRLHMLVEDAYVVVNSHDLKTGEFRVRAVAGLGNRLDAVLRLMGRKPEGTVFTLTAEQQQEYATDKLKHIAGGLSGLSFGQLPKSLTALLVKAFNVGDVYAMTLFHRGAILGSVNILLRRKAVPLDPEVVETFINQAAVALQRRLAQDELRRHQQHLEELVTERTKELKQVQEALVRQERLAAIGKVAGSMAHEIRNPLAAMRNAAYFLSNSLGPKLEGKAARHLDILDHEIDVTNSIITSVLDFARGRPAELLPHNLNDVLETARERAGLPPSVQVRSRIPSDLPQVRVDLQQMVQVFINLLVNAAQAMEGKGRITVSAGAGNGKVRVSFNNDGPEIKPEDLPRVFEPLFSTKTVGIGMGLAVCKAFVEAGSGTIKAESEPGKGATFTVTLPAAE